MTRRDGNAAYDRCGKYEYYNGRFPGGNTSGNVPYDDKASADIRRIRDDGLRHTGAQSHRSEGDPGRDHCFSGAGYHAFPDKRHYQISPYGTGTGPDRIVNAVAGYEIAEGPAVVIDFGTATTYDLIGPERTLEACIIAPGIETAGRSLWGGAAMLPAIQIRKPDSILAHDTVTGMQGGLVYGAIGQTEYIVRKMKEESGYQDAYVIATGGLGKIIAKETECIDLYDPQLTLNGLRLIYERLKK